MQKKQDNAVNKSILSSVWFYVLCLFVLTVIVFGQFIFSDKMLFASDQLGGFDSRVFLKTSIERFKQFPFWFSSRLGGMPSVDAMFGDALYFPSLIINSIFSIPRAIGMKMIAHVFLAGVFFFLLLRKGFGLSPFVSFVGACFYMFNPQFVSHIYSGHDGKMFVIAWVPFIVWRLKALMETPNFLNVTFVSFGIGMCILTSHIQMTYFVLWGLFFYWLLSTFLCIYQQKDRKKALTITGTFWLSVFMGLGIGLIQFLPSMMFVRNAYSVRGVEQGIDFATSWSLHWPEVFSLWIPEFANSLDYYWGQNPFKLNTEYAGGIALLLAVLAIVSRPNSWRIFWGGFSIFTLLYSLGVHTPVFNIAYYIVPGVNKFRAASMLMFWFSFGTVLLAVLFLKDLVSGKFSTLSESENKKWTKGIYIAIGSCFLITILFSIQGFVEALFGSVLLETGKNRVFEANFSKNFVPYLWLWMLFALSVLALFLGVIKNKISPQVLVITVFVLGMVDIIRVDLFQSNRANSECGYIKLLNSSPYFRTEPVLAQLGKEMDQVPFRCFALPGALPKNGVGIHGLETIDGFHDNELRWCRDFRGGNQSSNYLNSLISFDANGQPFLQPERLSDGNQFLDIANVKYLLVRAGNGLQAIENKNALGRVSFVQNFTVSDTSNAIKVLSGSDYDYRNTILLYEQPEKFNKLDKPVEGKEFSSRWEMYSPNYRKVKVSIPSNGFLRISETYYPGWEITIDGERARVYQADVAWMGVEVTPGEHVVEMRIRSIWFDKALWVSGGIMLIIAIYWLFIGFTIAKSKNGKSQKNPTK